MMNPEHPSNDDDVIELTDEVPIDPTEKDVVLEPMEIKKPVFPGNMVQSLEVGTLQPRPLKLIQPQETKAPETPEIPLMEGLEDVKVHNVPVKSPALSDQETRTQKMQSQAGPREMRGSGRG